MGFWYDLTHAFGWRGIVFQFNRTMPGTWVGHGTFCWLLVVAGVSVGGFFEGWAPFGGLVGASIGLLFYLYREEYDKRVKLKDGIYDEQARLDKVGDTVAAAFVYATALIMYVATIVQF